MNFTYVLYTNHENKRFFESKKSWKENFISAAVSEQSRNFYRGGQIDPLPS